LSDQYMIFVPGSTSPPQGPLSLTELQSAIRAKKFPGGAKVSRVGDTSWKSIHEVVSAEEWVQDEPGGDRNPPQAEPETEIRFEVTVDGENIVGPVTLDQLRRGVEAGKLPRDAKARRVGEAHWKEISLLLAPARPSPQSDNQGTGGREGPALRGRKFPVAVVGTVAVLLIVTILAQRGIAQRKAEQAKAAEDACFSLLDKASLVKDLEKAKKVCSEAVKLDASGSLSQRVGERTKSVEVEVNRRQAEFDRREAEVRAQRAADRAKAEASRRRELERRISIERSSSYDDDECMARSLPPTSRRFGRGTMEEIKEFAGSLGCRQRYPDSTVMLFCCPK
jgi:hypothetical protein